MMDSRHTRTYGGNNPMHRQVAAWDGHRSVRLAGDDIGLATTAYSYKLSYEELTEAAERIAILWNLHLGTSTEELRRLNPARQTKMTGLLPELLKLIEAMPKTDRGFSWEARDWQGNEAIRAYNENAKVLKFLLDNTEQVAADIRAALAMEGKP